MNLQHARIMLLCEALSLPCVAQGYGAAAQSAVRTELSYSDFLEGLLKDEAAGRKVRKQTMMTRLAGFPVIKTLDDFSYDCWRRRRSEPPCRFNIEPGLDAVQRTSVCG